MQVRNSKYMKQQSSLKQLDLSFEDSSIEMI